MVIPPRLFTPRTCTPATPINADSTGNAHDRFGFFDSSTNRADRQIQIDDLAFAPALRFRRAERRELHAAVIVQLADQGARLGAADIERNNMPFLLRQMRLSSKFPPLPMPFSPQVPVQIPKPPVPNQRYRECFFAAACECFAEVACETVCGVAAGCVAAATGAGS